MATIQDLKSELCGLIRRVSAFAENGFSVYDVDDAVDVAELQSLPVAAVMYDGSLLVTEKDRNSVVPVASGSHGVAVVTRQFTVLLLVEYKFAGQDDTTAQATALLEQLLSVTLGYKGVNSRPWRFIQEKPEPSVSGDGIVVYSQVWQVDVVVKGTSIAT